MHSMSMVRGPGVEATQLSWLVVLYIVTTLIYSKSKSGYIYHAFY